jgi:hypothetical protein
MAAPPKPGVGNSGWRAGFNIIYKASHAEGDHTGIDETLKPAWEAAATVPSINYQHWLDGFEGFTLLHVAVWCSYLGRSRQGPEAVALSAKFIDVLLALKADKTLRNVRGNTPKL